MLLVPVEMSLFFPVVKLVFDNRLELGSCKSDLLSPPPLSKRKHHKLA
jgi:hypothetical protein